MIIYLVSYEAGYDGNKVPLAAFLDKSEAIKCADLWNKSLENVNDEFFDNASVSIIPVHKSISVCELIENNGEKQINIFGDGISVIKSINN